MRPPVDRSRGWAFSAGGPRRAMSRALPEECALAMVYDGSAQAVMMLTPADLEDFVIGFSLTEGFVADPSQIERIEFVPQEQGTEARIWLGRAPGQALVARRRAMLGPVGCGLCGIDSLSQALRDLPDLTGLTVTFSAPEIRAAPDALRARQPLHDRTHGLHAAGFLRPGAGLILAREDVGRHNALDKLIGALAGAGMDAAEGAIVLTSRLSVDLVQKAAIARCPIVIAASAPTAHALRLADQAGITLAGFARAEGFEVFTHHHRIHEDTADVA